MSSAETWLKSQRKSDLVEIAEKVGLQSYDSLKKADLETTLNGYLRENETKFSREPQLAQFYKRVNSPASPVKKESSTIAVASDNEAPKKRSRKSTVGKVLDEVGLTDESGPESAVRSALATRTPRSHLSFPANVPLPPSPAVVADAIERRTSVVKGQIERAITKSGFTETAEQIRETLSSVAGIEALILLAEGAGLQKELLPFRYAFTTPGFPPLRIARHPVSIPDFFMLLTSAYWGPTTVWITTSIVLPAIFAYFFNLTVKSKTHGHGTRAKARPTYEVDPLAFNVVKAVIAYLVYGHGVTFGGWISESSVATIQGSVPGGYEGLLIGSGIGILTSLYDAVLKK